MGKGYDAWSSKRINQPGRDCIRLRDSLMVVLEPFNPVRLNQQ